MIQDDNDVDPEDILHAALHTLYDYQPVTLTSSGSIFSYTCKSSPRSRTRKGQEIPSSPSPTPRVVLRTPDTHPSNWSLHASSIWASSQYVADHLDELHLDSYLVDALEESNSESSKRKRKLLELGAGAGLPGIVIAKMYPDILVTCSDYPDEQLIQTLTENIVGNGVSSNCRAVAYAWGSDPKFLLASSSHGDEDQREPKMDSDSDLDRDQEDGQGFDLIIAADTLWNPDLHGIFIDSLKLNLKKSSDARVHLVAGLHTGRYTLQKFLDTVGYAQPGNEDEGALEIESVLERESVAVGGVGVERPWDVSWAETEDEKERRRWVVWMVLKWSKQALDAV